MRKRRANGFVLGLVLAVASAATAAECRYTVRLPAIETNSVDVVAVLTGLPESERSIVFREAEAIAFTRLSESVIASVSAEGVGGESRTVERTGPFAWEVERVGGDLTLRYRVPLTHREQPEVQAAADEFEYPYRAADHGLLIGGAIFLEPELDDCTFTIELDLGDGVPVVTSLDRLADGTYRPRPGLPLQDAIVAYGAFATSSFAVDGATIRVAFAPGSEPASDQPKHRDLIERIVRHELSIFGRTPFRQYLFVFVPAAMRGFSGTVKSDAILMSVGRGMKPGRELDEAIGHLVAHEFFHTWSHSLYTDDELRFVSEGFTDYFAYATLGRLGVMSQERLTDVLSERIAQFERSALASAVSLRKAGGPRFFERGPAYTQVYTGGFVVASVLDNLLRAETRETIESGPRDLDSFLRGFQDDPRWTRNVTETGRRPRVPDFLDAVELALDAEARDRIDALISRSMRLPIAESFAAAGVSLERRESRASPSLNANLRGTKLIDLDPDCAPYAIGLRAGDELLAVNGTRVSSAKDAHSCFARPGDGRMRLDVLRDGKSVTLDAAVPPRATYRVGDSALAPFAPP